MPDDNALDQNEIERLLGGGGFSAPPPAAAEPTPPADAGAMSQADLDSLFGNFGGGDAVSPAATPPPPSSSPFPAHTAAFPDHEPLESGPPTALDQMDIENLFRGAPPFSGAATPPSPPPVPPPQASAPPPPPPGGTKSHLGRLPVSTTVSADEEGVAQGDLDYMLRRADESLDSISAGKMEMPNEVIEFQFPEFGGTVPNVEHATLDQISEVELDVKIELGRSNMYLEDVLKLRKGSVVPLDKMAGDAVDIYVNNRLLARGEVLVMNENFCVRVAELLAGAIPME